MGERRRQVRDVEHAKREEKEGESVIEGKQQALGEREG